MMRLCSALAAVVGLAASAVGQVSIVSGFDSPSNWTVLFINTVSSATNIASSGGNPGGFADLQPLLESTTLGGAGFYQTFPFITLGSPTPITDVVMSADYRWFSGPTVTLVPFLWQGNRLYRPSASFALGTSTAWTGLDPMTFPLSSFSTSSGVPLSYQAPTQAGFMAIITSATPTTATGRVGIDNLNLQLIPGPGTGVVVISMVAATAMRRRRNGTGRISGPPAH